MFFCWSRFDNRYISVPKTEKIYKQQFNKFQKMRIKKGQRGSLQKQYKTEKIEKMSG